MGPKIRFGYVGLFVLSSVTVVLAADTSRRIADWRAGLVTGTLMIGIVDVFAWTTRLLSDTAFTFAVAVTVWQLVRYEHSPTRRNRVLAFVALGYVAIVKVQGLPIVVGYLLWDLTPRRFELGYDILAGRRALSAIGVVAVPLVGAIAVPAVLSFVHPHWIEGSIVQFDQQFQYQYTPRASTGVLSFVARNADHILVISLWKIAVFWQPTVYRLSTAHNVINLVTVLPVTVLGWAGLARAARHRPRLARTLGTPVIALTAVVGLTFSITAGDTGHR